MGKRKYHQLVTHTNNARIHHSEHTRRGCTCTNMGIPGRSLTRSCTTKANAGVCEGGLDWDHGHKLPQLRTRKDRKTDRTRGECPYTYRETEVRAGGSRDGQTGTEEKIFLGHRPAYASHRTIFPGQSPSSACGPCGCFCHPGKLACAVSFVLSRSCRLSRAVSLCPLVLSLSCEVTATVAQLSAVS